jgi:hypothetical protein
MHILAPLCYTYFMAIEQTVEIPASHRLTIEVPPEVPAGRTILTFTPAPAVPAPAKGQSKNAAFRNALRRAYGAWEEKPRENALADIRALREEWDHRDPCNATVLSNDPHLRDFQREGYAALPVVPGA